MFPLDAIKRVFYNINENKTALLFVSAVSDFVNYERDEYREANVVHS